MTAGDISHEAFPETSMSNPPASRIGVHSISREIDVDGLEMIEATVRVSISNSHGIDTDLTALVALYGMSDSSLAMIERAALNKLWGALDTLARSSPGDLENQFRSQFLTEPHSSN